MLQTNNKIPLYPTAVLRQIQKTTERSTKPRIKFYYFLFNKHVGDLWISVCKFSSAATTAVGENHTRSETGLQFIMT